MLTAFNKTFVQSPADAFSGASSRTYDSRPKIGLLAGNDISTLIALNSVIPNLIKAGYEPVLYMADHRPSKKPAAKQIELQTLSFYERYISNNVIFPIIDSIDTMRSSNGKPRTDIKYSPQQLSEVYGIQVKYVQDINSTPFVAEIKSETNMPILTSFRCYQIAHESLIAAQTNKRATLTNGQQMNGAFWNMHPGKLPTYQGIFGPIYAMEALQRTYSWTLHELIYDRNDAHKGIDKGPVITQTTGPIDYTKPAINLYLDFAEPAAKMLYDRVEDYFRGEVPTTLQSAFSAPAKYHTHPDPSFFTDQNRWPGTLRRLATLSREKGFIVDPTITEKIFKNQTEPEIVDFAAMADFIPRLFSGENDAIQQHLRSATERAIMDWESNKRSYTQAHAMQHPESPYGVIDHALITGKPLPNGYRIDPQQYPQTYDAQNLG